MKTLVTPGVSHCCCQACTLQYSHSFGVGPVGQGFMQRVPSFGDGAYHAMLQEGGVKLLKDHFLPSKASPLTSHAGEGSPHLALRDQTQASGSKGAEALVCRHMHDICTTPSCAQAFRGWLERRTMSWLVLPSESTFWNSAIESKKRRTSPANPPCRPGAPIIMQSAASSTCGVTTGAASTASANLSGSSPRTGSLIRYTLTSAPGICMQVQR